MAAALPDAKGYLRGHRTAVVGVIANLSLWFALHVLTNSLAKRHMFYFVL